MSISEVALAGSRLETLKSLRDLVARQLEVTESGRDVAALSLRLAELLEQIETCEKDAAPSKPGTALDEFTKRLAAREAAGANGTTRRAK